MYFGTSQLLYSELETVLEGNWRHEIGSGDSPGRRRSAVEDEHSLELIIGRRQPMLRPEQQDEQHDR